MVAEKETKGVAWWGSHKIPEGQRLYWHVGPFRMWLEHGRAEWRVWSLRGEDPLQDALVIAAPDPPAIPAEAEGFRFGLKSRSDEMELRARLADRPMVVGAADPFFLPPGESVTLYVSTPLWLELRVGPQKVSLLEQPMYRPSDSWFGPNTRVGELCYASRTHARMDMANLPHLPQRAISAIKVHNHADTQLALERLRLPMPHLSLFADAQGMTWTESVHFEREADGADARLRLSDGPPSEAGKVSKLGRPRELMHRGLLTRAFGGLFASRGGE